MPKKRERIDAAEVERLRARLEDAEQTLEAIRLGRVDAILVQGQGDEGDRVFTLQGADHRYRRIVEGMKEGAAIVTLDGIVVYANTSFARLVDSPLERLLGSRLRQCVPEPCWPDFDELFRSAGAGDRATCETRLLAAGEPVAVHVSAVADFGPDWRDLCLVVTDLSSALADAEERKRALSAALAEKSRILEAALTHMPSALVVVDAQGAVTVANPRADELLFARIEELPISRSLIRGEEIRGLEVRLHPDGARQVWVSMNSSPLRGERGEIVGAVAVFDDISAQKRLHEELLAEREAERRARDEAEQATRLKDEFLATLSHELRTPLNAVLGWGRMLQAGSLAEDKRARAVDAIVRNAGAQNQLIEDLLDISRIISGKLRLTVEPVDVAQIIEAAMDVVRPAADAKGVRLKLASGKQPSLILGDAARLQQVVWNLLANAVKFTPRGGRVIIDVKREDDALEVSVSDTGAGIADEFLPYVFDRFRQQDGAITRRAGGLGLGLAIVKNLVELHGGRVDATSGGPNHGSSFVVRLPTAPTPSTATARVRPDSEPPPSLAPVLADSDVSGLKVLVVDDEPDARDLVRAALEHCDAVVSTADTASAALAMMSHVQPDVIVSDIGMPGEDGYSFIRRLRALSRENGGATPAIALTAYARAEDRARALHAGFQSHATKPVEPRELLILIASLAGR